MGYTRYHLPSSPTTPHHHTPPPPTPLQHKISILEHHTLTNPNITCINTHVVQSAIHPIYPYPADFLQLTMSTAPGANQTQSLTMSARKPRKKPDTQTQPSRPDSNTHFRGVNINAAASEILQSTQRKAWQDRVYREGNLCGRMWKCGREMPPFVNFEHVCEVLVNGERIYIAYGSSGCLLFGNMLVSLFI